MISFSKEANIATWATYSFRECKKGSFKEKVRWKGSSGPL